MAIVICGQMFRENRGRYPAARRVLPSSLKKICRDQMQMGWMGKCLGFADAKRRRPPESVKSGGEVGVGEASFISRPRGLFNCTVRSKKYR